MEDLRLLGPTTSSVPARASMLQIRFLHRKSRPTSEQGLVTLMQLRHGNKAMQRSVLSLVHHTHPPTAQLLDDAAVRNGLTDHGVQQLWAGVLGVMPRQSQRRLMQDADLS